tara:strand:- start:443 stop:907 length:465 start_codon:yes stop_codon:yes gene_type:complete
MNITFCRDYTKITYDEAVALYNHVNSTTGNILELGRLWGGSTRVICHAAKDRKVVSVDIKKRQLKAFTDNDDFKNLTLITADARYFRLQESFETVFIDVKPDIVHKNILNVWNNVTTYFIFHDYIKIKSILDKFINRKKLKILSLTDDLLVTKK